MTEAEGELIFSSGERFVEVKIVPDGSVLAGSTRDGNVIVWKSRRLGTGNFQKEVLNGNATFLYHISFSPDGRMLAGWGSNNNVILWTRNDDNANFELHEEHLLDDFDKAQSLFTALKSWEGDVFFIASSDSVSYFTDFLLSDPLLDASKSEQHYDHLLFRYGEAKEWVTSIDGRKLWYLPGRFRAWNTFQRGQKIVLYKDDAILLCDSEVASAFEFT